MRLLRNISAFWIALALLAPCPCGAYDNIYVHPYITEQAFDIWPNDTDHEIYTYLGLGYRDTGSSCSNAYQGTMITEGAKEEDDYDPVSGACNNTDFSGYYHHFYNPDNSDDDTNGLYGYPGALYNAKIYWQRALDYYSDTSTRGLAYWYLGRIAHLVGDITVPAHSHLDAHPAIINPDSYENHVTSHYEDWSSSNAKALGDLPAYSTLDEIFYNLAERSQYFPSDDVAGNTTNTEASWFTGWPDPAGWVISATDRYIKAENCEKIGDYMMPLAMQYTAALYRLFWQTVHPGEVDFSGSPRSAAVPVNVTFLDLSTNNATSWLWDFGDGATSSLKNPTHTYDSSGYYSVTLYATGADGTLAITKDNYINAGACSNSHIRIDGMLSSYSAIQDAYDSLSGGETVQIHAFVFSEALSLQKNISVKLQGGFDCGYSANSGFTTINGSLTIKGGTVTAEKLLIK
jgi:hypothetical protein